MGKQVGEVDMSLQQVECGMLRNEKQLEACILTGALVPGYLVVCRRFSLDLASPLPRGCMYVAIRPERAVGWDRLIQERPRETKRGEVWAHVVTMWLRRAVMRQEGIELDVFNGLMVDTDVPDIDTAWT